MYVEEKGLVINGTQQVVPRQISVKTRIKSRVKKIICL